MEQILKLKYTLDALFGRGTSSRLPKDIQLNFSRKTGRIRTVTHSGKILCTLRIDGGLAITPYCAQILLKGAGFKKNCIEIDDDAAPFVECGRSVFCKSILWCGTNIHIGDDVPILFQGMVIAVGKAVLSAKMMMDFERGVAVKVRDSVKLSRAEDGSSLKSSTVNSPVD